ncbi:hypothetical protein [Bradyrhizobium betae]|uniref:hypothetical protein n=1 Tax=Bradyrhizobium betae TaxID=244734 RepID=UPI00100E2C11|nr:hypothetical protein [Bradyrhizobium betae]
MTSTTARQGDQAMLDALLGMFFEMVLSAVGTFIVKLFGVENAAEIATVIIGLGFIVLGFAVALWGH